MICEAGSIWLAASSNVKLTLLTGIPSPASDMSRTVWPPGPTSRISKSDGYVWVSPTRLTVTLVTVPLTPETLIADGYGVAVPMSGAVIDVGFANALVAEPIFPMVRKFVTVPKLFEPSCSCSTATRV